MEQQFRVMTYNIQHGNDYRTKRGIDLQQIADIILAQGCDAVCLQEVRGAGEDAGYTDQCAALETLTGMQGFFAPALYVPHCGPYGNAVFSRLPVIYTQNISIPDPPLQPRRPGGMYETRCIARMDVTLPSGRTLTLLDCHMGLEAEEQPLAVAAMLRALDETPHATLVMGDFNMQPDDPTLQPLLQRLHDTAALLPEGVCTFPSDGPNIKIDYLLYNDALTLQTACVPRRVGSDHLPIVAQFTL